MYTDKVLSQKSREAAWTPVKNNYGYGWMLSPVHGHKQMGHGGGINGFSTYISRFPDDDAVVIVLSNNDRANTGGVSSALAGTLFGAKVDLPWERKEVAVDQKVLDAYAGRYQVTGTMYFVVTVENGRLMLEPQGRPKAELFASSEKTFFLKVADATVTFDATGLAFEQGGSKMSAAKLHGQYYSSISFGKGFAT